LADTQQLATKEQDLAITKQYREQWADTKQQVAIKEQELAHAKDLKKQEAIQALRFQTQALARLQQLLAKTVHKHTNSS
jgi:hypothetical protein